MVISHQAYAQPSSCPIGEFLFLGSCSECLPFGCTECAFSTGFCWDPPDPCNVGYYLPTPTSDSCSPCPDIGCNECEYSTGVCTDPLPPASCPSGQYIATSTGFECVACPISGCLTCAMYTGVCTDAVTITTCPAGYYFPNGAAECIDCGCLECAFSTGFCWDPPEGCNVGYYLPTPTSDSCSPCPDNGCIECEYSTGVCTDPLPPASCPSGQYIATSTGFECVACPIAGCLTCAMFTGVCTDAVTITTCPAGQYLPNSAPACIACPYPGCLECNFSTGVCTNPPPTITSCPYGEYLPSPNAVACVTCPIPPPLCLECSMITGVCTNPLPVMPTCPNGEYIPQPLSQTSELPPCVACPVTGCLMCAMWTGVCTNPQPPLSCSVGQYLATPTDLACVACPTAGCIECNFSTGICTNPPATITSCPAGQYLATPTDLACVACPTAGCIECNFSTGICTNPPATITSCPAGQYLPSPNAVACVTCPILPPLCLECSMITGVCTNPLPVMPTCPNGLYIPQPLSQTTELPPCVACPVTGCLTCAMWTGVCTNPLPPTSCNLGQYLATPTDLSCVACPTAGCIQCNFSTGICTNPPATITSCPAGQYLPSPNALACVTCPILPPLCLECSMITGVCTNPLPVMPTCPNGQYIPQPLSQTTELPPCVACPVTGCLTCAMWTGICTNPPATITSCPAGQYLPSPNALACVTCPILPPLCLECSMITGVCTNPLPVMPTCPNGQYIPQPTSQTTQLPPCVACPVTGCLTCAMWTGVCTNPQPPTYCPVGQYLATPTNIACVACPTAGCQQCAMFTGVCTDPPCPAGQYLPSPNAVACVTCPIPPPLCSECSMITGICINPVAVIPTCSDSNTYLAQPALSFIPPSGAVFQSGGSPPEWGVIVSDQPPQTGVIVSSGSPPAGLIYTCQPACVPYPVTGCLPCLLLTGVCTNSLPPTYCPVGQYLANAPALQCAACPAAGCIACNLTTGVCTNPLPPTYCPLGTYLPTIFSIVCIECPYSQWVSNITGIYMPAFITKTSDLNPACLCLNTTINPFVVEDMLYTVFDQGVNQVVEYSQDLVSIQQNTAFFCGPVQMYLTVEDTDYSFYQEQQPIYDTSSYFLQLDPYNEAIYLNTTSFNDVGNYNVTLTVCILQGFICSTNVFEVTVLNPCFSTVIPEFKLQEIDYLIGQPKNSTENFILGPDSVSMSFGDGNLICGSYTVKILVSGNLNQGFASILQLSSVLNTITVNTKKQSDVGVWKSFLSISLPLYGISESVPFIIGITSNYVAVVISAPVEASANSSPFFVGYEDTDVLGNQNIVPGINSQIQLPIVSPADATVTVVIRPDSMVPFVNYESIDPSKGDHFMNFNLLGVDPSNIASSVQIVVTLDNSVEQSTYYLQATIAVVSDVSSSASNSTAADGGGFLAPTAKVTYPMPVQEPVLIAGVYNPLTDTVPVVTKQVQRSMDPAVIAAMRSAQVVDDNGDVSTVVLCVPTITQLSRKGQLQVLFNREIVPLTDQDIFNIENSGIIQMQIIPATPATADPANAPQLAITWSIISTNAFGFSIQTKFGNPGLVSSQSTDSDQIRVVFTNSGRYISCAATANSSRRLRKVNLIGGSGGQGNGTVGAPGQELQADLIPDNWQLVNSAPPQSDPDVKSNAESANDAVSGATQGIAIGSFAVAFFAGGALATLLGALNSLQMISMLPWNCVTFTSELYFTFGTINTLAGFDYFNPWSYDDQFQEYFGVSVDQMLYFSETNAYSDQFSWMGADKANFIYLVATPLGFIILLFIQTVFIIPICKYLRMMRVNGPANIVNKGDKDYNEVFGSWVVMIHENFVSIIQMACVSFLMMTITGPTLTDNFTFGFGMVLLAVSLAYTFFITWFSIYYARQYIFIERRDRLLEGYGLMVKMQEVILKEQKVAVLNYFDKNPMLREEINNQRLPQRIQKVRERVILPEPIEEQELELIEDKGLKQKPLALIFEEQSKDQIVSDNEGESEQVVEEKNEKKLDKVDDPEEAKIIEAFYENMHKSPIMEEVFLKTVVDVKMEEGEIIIDKYQNDPEKEKEEEWKEIFDKRFEALLEGLDKTKYSSPFNTLIMIWRRMVLLYVMLYLFTTPAIQVMIFYLLSVVNLTYLCYAFPFEDRQQNYVEIFNEACIALISLVQICLEFRTPNAALKTGLGWTMITFILFNLICGFALVVVGLYEGLRDSIKGYIDKFKKYRKTVQRQERMKKYVTPQPELKPAEQSEVSQDTMNDQNTTRKLIKDIKSKGQLNGLSIDEQKPQISSKNESLQRGSFAGFDNLTLSYNEISDALESKPKHQVKVNQEDSLTSILQGQSQFSATVEIHKKRRTIGQDPAVLFVSKKLEKNLVDDSENLGRESELASEEIWAGESADLSAVNMVNFARQKLLSLDQRVESSFKTANEKDQGYMVEMVQGENHI